MGQLGMGRALRNHPPVTPGDAVVIGVADRCSIGCGGEDATAPGRGQRQLAGGKKLRRLGAGAPPDCYVRLQLGDLRQGHLRLFGGQREHLEKAEMALRSEEHTSELLSLSRLTYALLRLEKKKQD